MRPLAAVYLRSASAEMVNGLQYLDWTEYCLRLLRPIVTNILCLGKIYQVNQDAVIAGGDECDPPWGFLSNTNDQFPGYCCREANGQEAQGMTGEEALAYLKGGQ